MLWVEDMSEAGHLMVKPGTQHLWRLRSKFVVTKTLWPSARARRGEAETRVQSDLTLEYMYSVQSGELWEI